MEENTDKFDLIIQNNASKETFLYSGLTDTSTTHLFHQFEDLEMDNQDGEYTYVLIKNNRNDVVYEFKTPLGDTVVHADGQTVILKDLQPATGLLRIGKHIKPENIYYNNKNNEQTFYYNG